MDVSKEVEELAKEIWIEQPPEGIRSMEEFQRKYFPNLVGKECPYCSSKIEQKKDGE